MTWNELIDKMIEHLTEIHLLQEKARILFPYMAAPVYYWQVKPFSDRDAWLYLAGQMQNFKVKEEA